MLSGVKKRGQQGSVHVSTGQHIGGSGAVGRDLQGSVQESTRQSKWVSEAVYRGVN